MAHETEGIVFLPNKQANSKFSTESVAAAAVQKTQGVS